MKIILYDNIQNLKNRDRFKADFNRLVEIGEIKLLEVKKWKSEN